MQKTEWSYFRCATECLYDEMYAFCMVVGVVSVARREYDSNQRHYNYPDRCLEGLGRGGGMRFSAVAWVSFFLLNIKPLPCTCVTANLLATGLEYVLALVFPVKHFNGQKRLR